MSEATILISSIETKPTSSGGTLYLVKDGNGLLYKTFKPEIGTEAQKLAGQQALIAFTEKTTEKDGRSFTDKMLDSVAAAPAAATGGDPDWDLIGLRKTRCALWVAYLEGDLASRIVQTAPEGTDKMDVLIRVGTRIIVHAERDIFGRPEGDDGIPFKGTE